jgi:adenylate cyclase
MGIAINIRVYEDGNLVYSAEVEGTAELGRQKAGERGSLLRYRAEPGGPSRIVIAPSGDPRVSRRHVLIVPLSEKGVRLTNLSGTLPVRTDRGQPVPPGGVAEVELPVRLLLANRAIHLDGPDVKPLLKTLEDSPPAPGKASLEAVRTSRIEVSPDGRVATGPMVRWIQATLGVLQSAAGSQDFLEQAARAAVEVAGLDSAAVLMREQEGWRSLAFHVTGGRAHQDWRPSQHVLNSVADQKRTVLQKPLASGDATESLTGVEAVVAAPILNREGEVVGVLYGDRRTRVGERPRGPVSELDALLVELVACAVAAGLSRLEQEQAALAARVRLEQFFTSELARQLELQPDLLKGKDTDVSILVADIRGFSRICERLGTARTFDWIRDMLGALSACVMARHGVLVDYIGDELMAMWGAPVEQPDHAELACRAALDMLQDLPDLNQRWAPVIGEAVDIGIGVNSGLARVGNVGSNRKFKYGPLGNTVNLASRVQGATKYLLTKALMTGATRTRVGADFQARRLCRARVVNIGEPVELYELLPSDQTGAYALQRPYERALLEFEAARFREAARLLGKALADGPNDGPSLVLMTRTLECLVSPPEPFDPVWTLPGK